MSNNARAIVAACLTAACLSTMQTANAADTKSPYQTEVVDLAKKASEGPLTDDEANRLISDYPDLAASLPDYRPGKSTEKEYVVPDQTTEDNQAEAHTTEKCSTAHRAEELRSLIVQQVLYEMETSVHFCWNELRVTKVDPPVSEFRNVYEWQNIEGEISNRAWIDDNHEGHAKHMYQVANEIPYVGVVGRSHPYNSFTFKPGGKVLSSGGH